jgi:hypothetical protein
MAASFPDASRYTGTDVATLTDADGRVTAYLRRRFLPQPERFALLQTHTVVQGERLDNLTATYLGDPEQFWQVADANRAMRPDDLMEVGRVLRITLPEGIPGVTGA